MSKPKHLPSVLIALISILISMLVADQVLALLGYPSEYTRRSVHPPNYLQHIKNIEFEYEFRTNSQGLRYREIPLEKPPNTYRVFVAGDSFVEGVGVQEDETLSGLLEKQFSSAAHEVNFINGGLSGKGPLEYGRALFDVGLRYQPDAVLICLYANDLENILPTTQPEDLYPHHPQRTGLKAVLHFLFPRTYTLLYSLKAQKAYEERAKTSDVVASVSKEARRRGIPQAEIEEWKERLPEHLVQAANTQQFNASILAYGLLAPDYWTNSLDIDTSEAELQWQAMASVLTEIVQRTGDLEIKIGVVFLPDRLQYDPDSNTPDNLWRTVGVQTREEWLVEDSEVQVRLRDWAERNDVPFLDLTPALREAELGNDVALTWQFDHHWTAEGNRVAAEAIAKWLREERLLEP